MAARTSPATVVICAPLPDRGVSGAARSAMPLTWVAGLDAILRHGSDLSGARLALALEPDLLDSRKTLRAALVRARHAAPDLEAVVIRGPARVHHSVLVEEGIRVAVVDAFTDVGRGSRRPAPAGWPCRNVAWGLWEVRACPPRRSRGWAWLPGLPAPRAGGVHIAEATNASLGRLLAWAERGIARGRAVGAGLGELPAIIEGGRSAALAASVLKAA